MLVPNLFSANGSASFELPLSDAGAGIASITTLSSLGSGTPTFTRATTAYTRLSTGIWELVGSGSPRSMYSAAGVYLGYWAEGARADVLGTTAVIRRDMSSASWVVGATMTKGTATGMDGGAGVAASMTGGAVEATNTVKFTTVLGSAAYTFSAWVRRKTGTGVVRITDNNGTNWTDITLTTTYQLFQVTRTQANPIVGFQIATSLDAIEIDFNTIEAATFANPTPIPVNVSKAADVLTYVYSGNANTAIGSAYAEVLSGWTANVALNPMVVTLGADQNNGWLLFANNPATATIINAYDGTNNVSKTGLSSYATAVQKVASSWGTGGISVTGGGLSVAAGSFDGSMGTASICVGIKTDATDSWFGSIRNVRLYNRALSAAQLQALTA